MTLDSLPERIQALTRYREGCNKYGAWCLLPDATDGEWVKWEDVQALLASQASGWQPIETIAGNIMPGYCEVDPVKRQEAVVRAVAQARAIVAEVERTEPSQEPAP